MENWPLLQRKKETCRKKRGTYQSWKGEKALLQIKRGTISMLRGALVTKLKAHVSYVERGTFWCLQKWGGGTVPPCPQEGRLWFEV